MSLKEIDPRIDLEALVDSELDKRSVAKENRPYVRSIFDHALSKAIIYQPQKQITIDRIENELVRLLDFCLGEFLFLHDIEKKPGLNNEDVESLSERAACKYILLFNNESREDISDSLSFYDVRISTLRSINLYLEDINRPTSKKNPNVSLINDIFETTFRKIDGFTKMMTLGLYPDALANWRNIHECECFIALLTTGGEKVKQSYIKHIAYNNVYEFLENFDKATLDSVFKEMKKEMSLHGLKSKDMKRFIDYGWLYDHPNYNPKDNQFKLNFGDGVERLAGLRTDEVHEVYQYTSELTHSSTIFFYVNDELCKNMALLYTYQSVCRIVQYYMDYMKVYFEHNQDQLSKLTKMFDDLKHISTYLSKNYIREKE